MTEKQILESRQMKWTLFIIFILIFVSTSGLTLREMFFVKESNLSEDERSMLFNTFLVSVGSAVLALFYSFFKIKGASRKNGTIEKEFTIRLAFEGQNDINSFFGKKIKCIPFAEHGRKLDEITCIIVESGGPLISIKPPDEAKLALLEFEYQGVEYLGSFSLGSYMVDMTGVEQ